MMVGRILKHEIVPVAVDLGAGEDHHPKTSLLLQTNQVLRPDRVRAPHRLVEILAVDPAELGGSVVDKIKGHLLENVLQLPVLAHVGPKVDATAKTVVVRPVENPDFFA